MDTDLGEYRRVVDQQPACDEAWFAERLTRLRSGDEAAGREISGSCLRLALRLAEEMPNPPASWSLLDLIQEANAGLVEGLASFTGTSAADFLQHARQTITRRLDSLPQQVG